jgi:hypothetical protein
LNSKNVLEKTTKERNDWDLEETRPTLQDRARETEHNVSRKKKKQNRKKKR